MKKRIIALVAAAAVLIGAAGCCSIDVNFNGKSSSSDLSSEKQTEINTQPKSEQPKAEEPKAEAKTNPDVQTSSDKLYNYIDVYKSASVDYTDEVGNSYSSTYTVPEILLNSEDASEVNSEIQRECEKKIRDSENAEKNKSSLICLGIEYEAWLNGNILSLTISEKYDGSYTHYLVYSFDVRTGEELDNDEFAVDMGISENELDKRIKTAMTDFFKNEYSSMAGDSLYDLQLNKTLSEDNVDEAEVYYGENGVPYVWCCIYSLAGAEIYEHLLKLN
ncbi:MULTISPECIES: hypothetical protein [unclassified Ruminococcus]|uniref:hypothetical protein n=1 Tax=unclassified Ruminococcus TaxID=2608920 RepID=UPI00210E867C|nr:MULTISPECIES: hypothetical protein [unclassified Ruminococcus]MCQ4022742.1 hypothetical protein [Ruminococcus sp. zg-924]MCQ4114982.1 hypothetical protein [Ruminococcus sp. zg-921]